MDHRVWPLRFGAGLLLLSGMQGLDAQAASAGPPGAAALRSAASVVPAMLDDDEDVDDEGEDEDDEDLDDEGDVGADDEGFDDEDVGDESADDEDVDDEGVDDDGQDEESADDEDAADDVASDDEQSDDGSDADGDADDADDEAADDETADDETADDEAADDEAADDEADTDADSDDDVDPEASDDSLDPEDADAVDAVDPEDGADEGIEGESIEDEESAVEGDDAYVTDEELDAVDYGADDDYEDADFADDGWAPDVVEDEADDAIPADETTWGENAVFEVVEVDDVIDDEVGPDDADDDAAPVDSIGVGEMLELRVAHRRPAKQGASSQRRPSSGGSRQVSNSRPAGGGRGARPGGPARSADDDTDTPYAFGGRPVSAIAVPWQVQIFNPKVRPDPANPRPLWQRSHYCGGALIAPEWVITAAHCIDQQLVDYGFKVRLGAKDIARGDGVVYRIERIVRHSQYDAERNDPAKPPNMYANDIALIRIAPEGRAPRLDPKEVRPIAINRRPLADGVPVSVTGWGAVGSGDTQAASAALLRVDLRLMATATCQQRPTYGPQKIHGNVFCASHPTRSTCRGDSGGPVVLTDGNPVLVGIVSWGKKKCAGDGRPGVYTRIDRYAAWIEQAMKLPAPRNALP